MSNCFFWAVSRWAKQGGYLIIRRSYYGWWPHFIWSSDLIEFWEFNPKDKEEHKSPPFLFHGEVRVFKGESHGRTS